MASRRMPKLRKPGRPRGTTRGGSRHIQYRVSDAQYAELEAQGPTANAAAKARAFPGHRRLSACQEVTGGCVKPGPHYLNCPALTGGRCFCEG